MRPLYVSIAEKLGIVSKPMSNIGSVQTPMSGDDIYKIRPENWYTAKPYGFRRTLRGQNSSTIFFLPISPSNLNISTNFATNLIPTLYGTIEEHSEVRYFNITVSGTTGISPRFYREAENVTAGIAETNRSAGRAGFPVNADIAAGGFFSKTLGVVNKALNKASDVIDGTNKPNESGVYIDRSGYVAFHNLYKFLMVYKKDAAGVPTSYGVPASTQKRTVHPLTFFNYKDGNEYKVVIDGFVLRRSAENPMLYYYEISMRGYDIRTVESSGQLPDDLTQRLKDLGLDGVDGSSLLGEIKDIANDAKKTIGSVVGGVNIIGR